jgi:lipoprotein-releasing system permease protein
VASWVLHHAFRQLFPAGRRGRLFPAIAALGVAIGVAALIVVLSVMNGFQEDVRRQLKDWHGEITIGGSAGEDGVWQAWLESFPEILSVEAFRECPLLIRSGDRHVLVPARGLAITGGIRLGRDLLAGLGVGNGESVSILPVENFLAEGEFFLPEQLPVSPLRSPPGTAEVPLAALREMGISDGIDGYRLRLRRGIREEALAHRLNGTLEPPLRAHTWWEAGGELVAMLALEKSAMFLSLSCIIAMAAFCMASALAGNVARKTREIGLLLAIGCGKGWVALSFLLQSIGIGLLGIIIGSAFAAITLGLRDSLLRILMGAFGGEERLFAFYGFSHLPLLMRVGDLLGIFSLALGASLLAGLLPVFRILRMDPSQALHHE